MAERYFTLEEANELVPWLQSTFEALSPLQQQMENLEGELGELLRRGRTNGGSTLESRITEKRRALDNAAKRIEDGIHEISQKGIIVRDVERGLVDFPAQRESREVYLCWISGEKQVTFWHGVDSGFASRQHI